MKSFYTADEAHRGTALAGQVSSGDAELTVVGGQPPAVGPTPMSPLSMSVIARNTQ